MAQSKENKKCIYFLKTTWDIVSKGNMATKRGIPNEETDQAKVENVQSLISSSSMCICLLVLSQ